MTSVLDQELQHYFVQLNEAEKKSVLLMLKTFLNSRKEKPDRITIEQYNNEIDLALAEAAEGKYITQEEMEKEAAKW